MQKVQIELKRPPDWLLHGVKNLLFVILLLLFAVSLKAATCYVATNGSDSYSRLQAESTSTPWLTVGHAAGAVTSGDLVLIFDGTYAQNLFLTVNYTSET